MSSGHAKHAHPERIPCHDAPFDARKAQYIWPGSPKKADVGPEWTFISQKWPGMAQINFREKILVCLIDPVIWIY